MEVVFIKLLLIAIGKAILYVIELFLIVLSLFVIVFFEYAKSFIYIATLSFLDNINHVCSTDIFAIAIFHSLDVFTSKLRYNTIKIISQIYYKRPVIVNISSTSINHLWQQIYNFHRIECKMKTT